MYISLDKVLEKIDGELHHARQCNSDAEVRTRIHTIKSLCELVLDDDSQKKKVVDKKPREQEPSSAKALQEQKQSSRKTAEKDYYGYEDDDYFDEDHGDSIFDF